MRAKAVGQLIDAVPGVKLEEVVDVLIEGFKQLNDCVDIVQVNPDEIKDEQLWKGVTKTTDELKSSSWIFGKSPKFTIQLPDSTGQLKELVIEGGYVSNSLNNLYKAGSLFVMQ